MDRKPTAGELLDAAGQAEPRRRRPRAARRPRARCPGASRRPNCGPCTPWPCRRSRRKSPKAKELVDWLLAHRTGHRWSPDKATGPAALALCEWFAESRFEGEHYQLAVFVNDVQAKVLDIDAAGRHADDRRARRSCSKKGKQRINFQITGRGRYTYQCILGGFVPADKLKSTTARLDGRADLRAGPAGARRPRDPARLRRRSKGSYTTFRNPLTQLPVGRRGHGRAGRLAAERRRATRPTSNSSTWSSPSRSPAARR